MPDWPDYSRANLMLLCGEVSAALSLHLDCELEVDEHRNYTGRTIIRRPSGHWAVTVTPAPEAIPDA